MAGRSGAQSSVGRWRRSARRLFSGEDGAGDGSEGRRGFPGGRDGDSGRWSEAASVSTAASDELHQQTLEHLTSGSASGGAWSLESTSRGGAAAAAPAIATASSPSPPEEEASDSGGVGGAMEVHENPLVSPGPAARSQVVLDIGSPENAFKVQSRTESAEFVNFVAAHLKERDSRRKKGKGKEKRRGASGRVHASAGGHGDESPAGAADLESGAGPKTAKAEGKGKGREEGDGSGQGSCCARPCPWDRRIKILCSVIGALILIAIVAVPVGLLLSTQGKSSDGSGQVVHAEAQAQAQEEQEQMEGASFKAKVDGHGGHGGPSDASDSVDPPPVTASSTGTLNDDEDRWLADMGLAEKDIRRSTSHLLFSSPLSTLPTIIVFALSD